MLLFHCTVVRTSELKCSYTSHCHVARNECHSEFVKYGLHNSMKGYGTILLEIIAVLGEKMKPRRGNNLEELETKEQSV